MTPNRIAPHLITSLLFSGGKQRQSLGTTRTCLRIRNADMGPGHVLITQNDVVTRIPSNRNRVRLAVKDEGLVARFAFHRDLQRQLHIDRV